MLKSEDNFVSLVSVRTEVEASLIVTTLLEEGIEATRTGGFLTGFKAEAPTMAEVRVHQEDLERAQIVLDNIKSEMANMDWSQVDVGEPE